jgi:hypothetical protein
VFRRSPFSKRSEFMTEDPSEDWRGEGGGRMLGVVQILVHVSKEKDVGEAERAYKRGPFKRW